MNVIYTPGEKYIHAALNKEDCSPYTGQTAEELVAAYPGSKVCTRDEASVEIDKATRVQYCLPVVEITEKRFEAALNILPPENWAYGGQEFFRMCEYTTGTITGFFAKIGTRYFHAQRDTRVTTYRDFETEIRTAFFT